MTVRHELLEATDETIDDAVKFADPMVLRGLLYQLTGDESVATTEVKARVLGLVEAPDQEQAPNLESPRMRGIHPVAVRFERRPRCVEHLRRPGQVARDQCDLGLGNDTPRAGHRLFRTECARSTSEQRLCSGEIAKLRHRDASQRQRRRVVTQGDPLQCTDWITCRECARRSRDQRVHRNPVTLVTPTVRYPGAKLAHDQQRAIGSDGIALQPECPGARPIRRLQRP